MIQLGYEHLCLVINYGWRKQILSAITIATLVVMASTSFLGAQPDVNWNLTNTNDSQNSENDCTGLASQTDTAEDLPCQSYSADLYETTGDVEELCVTDLMVFRVGWDGTWFYWELELAGSWDVCSAGTGSGRLYMVETDTDQSSEADNKGDFIIQYEPEALHCRDDAETEEGPCDTDWDDAGTSGDGKVTLWEDSDNDYGYTGAGQGGTATGSDSQDPEGYTGYEDKKDPTDGQLWPALSPGAARTLSSWLFWVLHLEAPQQSSAGPGPQLLLRSIMRLSPITMLLRSVTSSTIALTICMGPAPRVRLPDRIPLRFR